MRFHQVSGCCLISIVLAGCSAGSGEGLDENGRPLGSDTANGPLTADFDSIQVHVFTPICSVCHAGATAPHGLRLDAQNSYDLLVGVASAEVPTILRVKPSDPDNSYLIQKIEGLAAVGERMPRGGPPLPAETIAVIRQWITDGAQRSPTSVGAASFQLASAVPAGGDVMTEAPKQVVLGFTRELDATRVDASAIRLEQFDPAASDTPPALIAVTLSVPNSNASALILTPQQPLKPGHYRVIASAGNGFELSDLAGQTLATPTGSHGERVITEFVVENSNNAFE